MSHFLRAPINKENTERSMIGKIATKAPTETRRRALGEVKNTHDVVVANKKHDLKSLDFKEVRARVDTHWRKEVQPKRVTRTDSQKLSGTTNTTVAPVSRVPTVRLVRTKTLHTEEPKEAVRITIPSKVTTRVKVDKVSEKVLVGQVKRQESTLTRRSLTKLKAEVRQEKSSSAKTSTESLTAPESSAKQMVEPFKLSHSTSRMNDIVLPPGVENIDLSDVHNLILVSEYVNDIYQYMNHLEEKFPIREDYLSDQKDVTPKMRGVLVDWLNEVHLQFTLLQETFFLAVAILDRYLQEVKTTSRQNLQLVGVTALFVASKYEEMYPPEISEFVYITDDTYTKKQILDMEQHILKKLQFQMGRPLPLHFLRRYAKAAHSTHSNDLQYNMAKYFIELASVDYSMAHVSPSQVAAASLLLALRILPGSELSVWNTTLEYYTNCTEQVLNPIVKQLATIVKGVPSSKLRSVHNKFKLNKYRQISVHPELTTTDALEQIIAAV